MVIFILNISIVNLFKQSNEVALFLPFSATYGVGGAPGRTANIHFQFRRFENAVSIHVGWNIIFVSKANRQTSPPQMFD